VTTEPDGPVVSTPAEPREPDDDLDAADPYDLPRISPRRIPAIAADRERAAYERGKAEGLRLLDAATRGAYEAGRERGLREATEGWERDEQWTLEFRCNGSDLLNGHDYGGWIFDSAEQALAHATEWRRDQPQLAYTDVRPLRRQSLVGPWEPAEQPDPITPEVYGEFFPERGDDGEPVPVEQPEPARCGCGVERTCGCWAEPAPSAETIASIYAVVDAPYRPDTPVQYLDDEPARGGTVATEEDDRG
jgi:hypothetical protein